jgi:hypothetical protein
MDINFISFEQLNNHDFNDLFFSIFELKKLILQNYQFRDRDLTPFYIWQQFSDIKKVYGCKLQYILLLITAISHLNLLALSLEHYYCYGFAYLHCKRTTFKKNILWRIHPHRGDVAACDVTGQCRTPLSPPAAT